MVNIVFQMNFILLFEEFNPAESRKKLATELDELKAKADKLGERIKRAQERGDKISIEILKLRMNVYKRDAQNILDKEKIVNFRAQRLGQK